MSLNDPQWGRGGASGDAGDEKRLAAPWPNGQDGPPELEELWRELNRRLGGLFGSGPDGPGDGGGGSEVWRAVLGVGAVLAAILIIWMSTRLFISCRKARWRS